MIAIPGFGPENCTQKQWHFSSVKRIPFII
jgi:hypothetical protein